MTYVVVASKAGDLEDIVAPEHALVRLSRLVNSSNTYVKAFSKFTGFSLSLSLSLSLSPTPSANHVTFVAVAQKDRTAQDWYVCVYVCVCLYGAVVYAVDFQSKYCGFDPRRVSPPSLFLGGYQQANVYV